MVEEISGQVSAIRFRSEESHFVVASLRMDGRLDPVPLVGVLPGLAQGMRVKCTGDWDKNAKFGRQFRAISFLEIVPVTAEGIEAYLASGFIPGIGAKMAARVVAAFGTESLAVIAQEPKRLAEIKGLGKQRCQDIAEAFRERRAAQEAFVFLYGLGLTPNMAQRVYQRYGDDAIRVIKGNPYRLSEDVHNVGFHRADKVARSMGIDHTHPLRMAAGLIHTLTLSTRDGHCFLPRPRLIDMGSNVLDVDPNRCEEALKDLLAQERLVAQDWPSDPMEPAIYNPQLLDAEVDSARCVAALLALDVRDEAGLARIGDSALALGIDLGNDQARALEMALGSGTCIITGGPGTGKTTILRVLLDATSLSEGDIACAAPTGRAAKRLHESTGLEAKTIHRLLEFSPIERRFKRDATDPLDVKLVVIDEASMLDIMLFHRLVRAIPEGARLLLVGDVDQLPPVGAGCPFMDLIASGTVPVARLTQIFRQGRGSEIVKSAHRINQGIVPQPTGGKTPLQDFYFIRRGDPEQVVDTIRELVASRIPKRFGFDALRDVQVLSPMRSGALGIDRLNHVLQQRLNPDGESLTLGDTVFREGDKVMQVRNDYDRGVFNGDWGIIKRVQVKERMVTVEIDGQRVLYERKHLDDLVLAYAISVHKSQGSEYPVVVLPVMTQHFKMLKRNLLYTAVTRGRKLVIVVGTERAMEFAVSRADDTHRNSLLAHRLRAAMGRGSNA